MQFKTALFLLSISIFSTSDDAASSDSSPGAITEAFLAQNPAGNYEKNKKDKDKKDKDKKDKDKKDKDKKDKDKKDKDKKDKDKAHYLK